MKKGVLRNFEKFTEKQLSQGLFLIKLQVWGLFHRTRLVFASVYPNTIHGYVFIYQPYSLSFTTNRSDRLEVFCKIGALKNFAKFTGKHQRQSVFYNKVFSIKRGTSGQVFSGQFLRTASRQNYSCKKTDTYKFRGRLCLSEVLSTPQRSSLQTIFGRKIF